MTRNSSSTAEAASGRGGMDGIRRARLDVAMRSADIETLLVYGDSWQHQYLRYATNFGVLEGCGFALLRRDGRDTLFLSQPFEAERASVETPALEIECRSDIVTAVNEALRGAPRTRIGAGPTRFLPAALAAAELQLRDFTGTFDLLLMRKSPAELEIMRRAAELAVQGYQVFRSAARAGRRDYELIAEVDGFFRASGAEENFMLMGSGGPEVRGMSPPSGRVLRAGDMLTTEISPCIEGYYGQVCRTLVIGEPSERQRAGFEVFRRSLEAGIASVAPGITASDVAKAQNEVFRDLGLDQYLTSEYTRVRGHGLGLFADAPPAIAEDDATVLEASMVIMLHPNTYYPDVGYFVLGDAVEVTDKAGRAMANLPHELFWVPI